MNARHSTVAALLAGMAAVAGACGGNAKPHAAASATTDPNAAVITQASNAGASIQAVQAALEAKLGLHDNDLGQPVLPDQANPSDTCVLLLLSGRNQVDTYKNAGDPVVTNPSGTLGAKVVCSSTTEAANLAAVAGVLKNF